MPSASTHSRDSTLDLSRAATTFVPFATAVTTDFFSERIGCQVQQPIYGISLGALCIRDERVRRLARTLLHTYT